MRKLIFFMGCLFSTCVFSKGQSQIEHVIYITLDGVRWQDVYEHHQHFPMIWDKFKSELAFYGEPGSDNMIEVASVAVSLPSYQSQMTGSVQACENNDCGRVKVETFPEKLAQLPGFNPKDVALFGTWKTMHDSYQTELGHAFENSGNSMVTAPDTHLEDEVMREMNMLQSIRPRHDGDRYDYFTFTHAMHYFLTYQPKFMWIAFAESDNYAHAGDRAGYLASLRHYDDFFAQLLMTIRYLGLDDKTMVIVTTDHGRGNGEHWTEHGPAYPESKQTWALVWHGELVPMSEDKSIKHYSTLSIRPTIERIFTSN